MEGFILGIDDTMEYSESMYHAVKYSGAGYYRLNDKGVIIDVNDAWLKLYKYDNKEEVIGVPCSFLRQQDELDSFNRIFQKVIQGETLSGKIVVRKCKDGTSGRHISSASPFYVGNKIVGIEGFVLDISELEKNNLDFKS